MVTVDTRGLLYVGFFVHPGRRVRGTRPSESGMCELNRHYGKTSDRAQQKRRPGTFFQFRPVRGREAELRNVRVRIRPEDPDSRLRKNDHDRSPRSYFR